MSHIGGPLVECNLCHLSKKPRGRSAPMEMANGLCDQDCPGYFEEPRSEYLWPNEECEECAPYARKDGE